MQLSDQTLLRSQAYINGAWVHSHSGATLSVSNPADGAELALGNLRTDVLGRFRGCGWRRRSRPCLRQYGPRESNLLQQ